MKATIIGKPVTPPSIAQVQTESELLEQILRADIHEWLMDYARTMGLSPFQSLNQCVLQAIAQQINAVIKARYVSDHKDNRTMDKIMRDAAGN